MDQTRLVFRDVSALFKKEVELWGAKQDPYLWIQIGSQKQKTQHIRNAGMEVSWDTVASSRLAVPEVL